MPAHRGEKIFISYSHKDQAYLEDIKKILKPGIRDPNIFAWDDTNIKPGDNWREEIDKGLSSATVALLLVSKDYLASDFIERKEFHPIVDKVKKGELRVFWLLLNPCLWKKTKIEDYQALHEADKPLSKLALDKRQEKLVEICKRIVEEMKEPPSLIIGWRPYKYEDKDIFAGLQRQGFVETCVSEICQKDFRFGLLLGESGVGKTSVLQAGLWPRLEAEGYDCTYIDFTNDPLLDSIRRSFRDHNSFSETEMRDCGFISLLRKLAQQRSKPLVLLVDHFEKILNQPHQQLKDDFFQALASWYQDTSIPPIKMLVGVEKSFAGDIWPSLSAPVYSLHRQRCFLLQKLKEDEATEIVRIMAEREKLPFEPGFVERLTEESSSNTEKELSPAVLQFTAYKIKHSGIDKERAFTEQAFNRMGGINGIYRDALVEELEKCDPESKHLAEEILKALVDWNMGTRSDALTCEELKVKMDGGRTAGKTRGHRTTVEILNLSPQKLGHTLEWLCSCRFITPRKKLGVDAYELSYDWLPRTVMKLLGNDIEEAQEADLLLTKRCNYWTDNGRASRFLLTRDELRLIEQHQQYIDLDDDGDKRDLIQESNHQVRWRMAVRLTGAIGSVVLLVCLIVWFNPPYFFPLRYAKDELLELSDRNRNMKPETRAEIAKALFFSKDFEGAREVIGQIAEDWDKDVARSEIVKSVSYDDGFLHKEAAALAGAIRDHKERAIAQRLLEEVKIDRGDAFEYPSNRQQSISPITKAVSDAALESDPIEKLDVMAALVQAATHRAETSSNSLPHEMVQAVRNEMKQQLEIVNNRPGDDFRKFQGMRSAAEIAAYLDDGKRAFEILDKAKQIADEIPVAHEQALAMRSLAIAAAKFALLMAHDCRKPTCNLDQVDKLLRLAKATKNAITEDGEKYAPLSSIVEAQVARASISGYPRTYLEEARNTAKEIYSKAHLSSALRLLVTEMVKLGYVREAVAIAEQNETDVKGDLLAKILLTSTEKAFSFQGKNYRPPRFPQEAKDDMVYIPAGHFTMGIKGAREETPAHTVYVDGFWLDSSETTVELYDKFLNETGRKQKPEYWKEKIPLSDREKPVIGVTWGEANAYCRWRQKRLPTEAEWEKAARGTNKRKYPWGDSRRKDEKDKEPANYDREDPKGDPYSVLTKVGHFKDAGGDSPDGIHDMAGNAWEWVEDWYDSSVYVDIHSGGYPASSRGDVKILRGGSWDNTDKDDKLRSTFRLPRDPKDGYRTYGFRCAQSIETPFDDASQLPPQGNF